MDAKLLLSDLFNVISTWKTLGAIAALSILAGLLVQLSKSPSINRYVNPRWRPVMSAVLGGLAAVLAGISTHLPPPNIMIFGLVGVCSGLGATGFHELMMALSPTGKLEADAQRLFKAFLLTGEDSSLAQNQGMRSSLTQAMAVDNPIERMELLSKMWMDAKKQEATKSTTAAGVGNYLIFFLPYCLFFTSSCAFFQYCVDHPTDVRCHVTSTIIDCTGKAGIGGGEALAEEYIKQGNVSTEILLSKLLSAGFSDAECIIAELSHKNAQQTMGVHQALIASAVSLNSARNAPAAVNFAVWRASNRRGVRYRICQQGTFLPKNGNCEPIMF